MKKLFLILILFSILISTSCSENTSPGTNEPAFMDVEDACFQARDLYFGSDSWRLISFPESNYVYAAFYGHLFRYNVSKNVIDKAIVTTNQQEHWEPGYVFSKDGEYAVSVSEYVPDYGPTLGDIYLINFTKNRISFISSSFDNLEVDSLPEGMLKEKDGRIEFSSYDRGNYDILAHSYHYDDNGQLYFVSADGHNVEIPDLNTTILMHEFPFVCLDENTICSLVPDEAPSDYLGYYKFIVIDLTSGRIIKELRLNDYNGEVPENSI